MTYFAEFEEKSAEELDRWCRGFLLFCAEDFVDHPQRGYENMCRVSEECRLVAFNQMPQPGQGESRRNQQQPDDPVEPDDDQGGKANRNGDHVQRTIDGMIVCAVVM
jgi:hypothetical protein